MERERSRIRGAVWIVAKGVRVLEDDDGGRGGDRGGGQVRAKVYAGWTAGRGGGAIAVIREERLG